MQAYSRHSDRAPVRKMKARTPERKQGSPHREARRAALALNMADTGRPSNRYTNQD